MPPKAKRTPRRDLVAPPVFARILPENVGGHVDDGASVYKRLASWSDAAEPNRDAKQARVTLVDGHGETHYAFPKRVFGPSASQDELFREVARPLLRTYLDADDPQSAFVFAYGQTGTGKTYTLMGPEFSWSEPKHDLHGLFPRVVDETLTTLAARKRNHPERVAAFALGVTAVEFYFCQGFDLLDDHAQVRVEKGELIGARSVEIKTASDTTRVMNAVRDKRTTASTKMNPTAKTGGGGSSRSHCALTLTTRVVDGSGAARAVTFTCMDLAGAERQSSNGNENVDALEAIMSYWRDPATVKPCAQAAIINVELSALRSAIVQSAEAHRRGRPVAAPTQLGTAAVNYMTDAFDGRCHVANVVTLSQAPKCGWETWFACTYAEDFAKLRMPASARSAAATPVAKLWRALDAKARDAKEALARTPATGHPSSKFHARRKIEARHFAREAAAAAELLAGTRGNGA